MRRSPPANKRGRVTRTRAPLVEARQKPTVVGGRAAASLARPVQQAFAPNRRALAGKTGRCGAAAALKTSVGG